MTYQHPRMRDAEPGEVWVLTHRSREPHGISSETHEHINTYIDPRRAIHDLAQRIRPHWEQEAQRAAGDRSRPSMPAQAPDDDFAAVALFFANPGRDDNRAGFHTYSLQLHSIDTTPAVPHQRQYIFVHPYAELTCICGNQAAATGFAPCDVTGIISDDGPVLEWDGHYLCHDCGRIIHNDTGLVVGHL